MPTHIDAKLCYWLHCGGGVAAFFVSFPHTRAYTSNPRPSWVHEATLFAMTLYMKSQ